MSGCADPLPVALAATHAVKSMGPEAGNANGTAESAGGMTTQSLAISVWCTTGAALSMCQCKHRPSTLCSHSAGELMNLP